MLLVAMLGLAQYGEACYCKATFDVNSGRTCRTLDRASPRLLCVVDAAAGDIHQLLMKHHIPSPAPAPPVVVSGPRQCITVPELAKADGNFTALLAAAKVSVGVCNPKSLAAYYSMI